MRREWMLCVLLAALTLGVFWPVRNFDFVYYDDPQFIAENPQVSAGLSWPGVIYAFTQPVVGNWHPVTTLSHMLDCWFFGAKPGPQHLINASIHALNAALLFLLLSGLTGAAWRSALVAALFALHPLRVESVAWISERKDVLSGCFFLLTLLTWARATRGKIQGGNPPSNRNEAGALSLKRPNVALPLVLYAFGLMSKPMLVTLPFVLLLMDIWPLRRFQPDSRGGLWPLFREKIPFFVLAAVCSAITLWVQKNAGAMSFAHRLTFLDRLVNAIESCMRYLGKLVWPTKLSVVYPHPALGYALNDAWPLWEVLISALFLILLTSLCLLRLRRHPYLAVGWFWFLGTLLPVIGLVQVGEQAMANRYSYIPLIGPVVALVWGIADLWNLRSGITPAGVSKAEDHIQIPASLWISSALLITALVGLTHKQLQHWRNTVSLFDYAVAVTPDNPAAHFALGVGLEKEGKISQAMVQYRVALAIDPRYSKAHYNMGQLLYKAGDIASAAAHFEGALRANTNDLSSRLNLANSLQRLRRTREAIAQYEEALRRDPESIEALNNLAWIFATNPDPQLRDGKRAVELAQRAVTLSHSKYPVMIGTLAAAYAEAARFTDAVTAAEKAAKVAADQGQNEVAERNQELLQLYRSGQAYHEDQ